MMGGEEDAEGDIYDEYVRDEGDGGEDYDEGEDRRPVKKRR